jgi:hypothetical protein
MLFYGAPLVAVLAVIASFWTPRRSWGTLIPLAALAFFGIDRGALADFRAITAEPPAKLGTLSPEFSG